MKAEFRLKVFDPVCDAVGVSERVVSVYMERHALRIIFDDNNVGCEHDMLIERHPDKWLILLHGNGEDPVAAIEITDDAVRVEDGDGKLVHETGVDPVYPMTRCERCDTIYDETVGDGYCGLCPSCADATDQSSD